MSAPSSKTNVPRRVSCRTFATTLSCCLFFALLTLCLFAALVLIGRHLHRAPTPTYPHAPGPLVATSKIFPPKPPLRLNALHIRPIHYDLTLFPYLLEDVFRGLVNVTVDVEETVRKLFLHSKGLSVDAVEVFAEDGEEVRVQNVEEDVYSECIVVWFVSFVNPGRYYVNLRFGRRLDSHNFGFYKSTYRSHNDTRVIATTKFEPTYARHAFPCFDEPNMKANFTVHILKPKDEKYIALSNMPQVSEKNTTEGNLVTFKTSLRMSTYLLAFIVCDFDYTERFILPDSDKIPLRVYATPAQIEKTKYASELAVGAIQFFIDYYGIKYPLPKLDLVAIPDFVSGAMENWGLVTFRETALLFDPKTASTARKQRVAEVISHELTHSWFGNLVTMNWWNDLWLNEGFATYIEYKGVDAVHPDWQMLDQFAIATLHGVLGLDATLAAHPIVQNVTTPDQITEIFDTITYSKGASLLRMLETAVGEEAFRKGVTNYLNKHLYDNAVTQHLLDELQLLRSDLNVKEFMNTFTIQSGYPLVSVVEKAGKYVLSQKRFLKDPANAGKGEKSPYGYKWMIPINYVTDQNSTPVQVWFHHENETISIDKPANITWIKFNRNQTGYYRVTYETKQWKILADNIKFMSTGDKTHLLEEAFSIAETGELPYNIPLDMTKYLKEETNYIPWSVAYTVLNRLQYLLMDSNAYTKFQGYVSDIVKPAYQTIGWTEKATDGHLTKLARVVVLELACLVNLEDSLTQVSSIFRQWLHDPKNNTVSQDLKIIVYKYGIKGTGTTEWEKLWNIFVEEEDASEKLSLSKGLAATKDPALFHRVLNLAKDSTYIRDQDYLEFLITLSQNPVANPIVWDYVREHWKLLVDRFTLNNRYLGRMIPGITRQFLTTTKLKELENFFAANPEAGAGASARVEALENLKNNIKWLQKNRETVEDWLIKYNN